ncbi:MAG: sporulation membrane protein YtaF [Oscillospiraceae bacterium]
MNFDFLSLFHTLILVIALSIDAFVASFAYGTDRIKIPFSSLLVITLICSSTLGLSLFIGGLIAPYLPPKFTSILCFLILLILGIVKLFDSTLKAFIKRHQSKHKKVSFTLFDIKFILQIYIDSRVADKDQSRRLSPSEATSLAIALSLDGLGVGFGAGLVNISIWQVLLCSIISTILAVLLGALLGRKISTLIKHDLSWLGGALLIILAFMKL